METNLGSFLSLESEKGRFTRLYIPYAACVEGYLVSCRPLIFLWMVPFKDRYKGTLLAVTAYDGDNGLFSLTFCVCDIENEDNWN